MTDRSKPRGRLAVHEWSAEQLIRTERLELLPLPEPFVDVLLAGDVVGAGHEIGALVGSWFRSHPAHFAQLRLASRGVDAMTAPGLGWAIVRVDARGQRRLIGSIGFHGSPDDRGRLELGCRLHPAYRGRGFTAEAVAAFLDWAAATYGITRFLVSVSSSSPPPHRVPRGVQ